MSKQYVLIGRGKNGWHADGMYDKDSTFSSTGGTLDGYISEAPEGCPVYDCEESDYDAFAKLVIGGPMHQAGLPPGTIDSFGKRKALLGMLPGLQDGFKTLATMALAGLSSLDFVATDVYLQLLRGQVPGVKIGKVVQGKIVWEEHRETPIE